MQYLHNGTPGNSIDTPNSLDPMRRRHSGPGYMPTWLQTAKCSTRRVRSTDGAKFTGLGSRLDRRGIEELPQRFEAKGQSALHIRTPLRSEEHTSELQSPCNL